MNTRIVKDANSHSFSSLSTIKSGLDYFRKKSDEGLHKLSDVELEKVKQEFNSFFNCNLLFYADKYPTKLFRISNNDYINKEKNQKLGKISHLIGPPEGKSYYGRCNMPTESVFYAALDVRTALWETQPRKGDYITLSEWKIKENQKIYTHTIFHPLLPNLSEDSHRAQEEYNKFIENINPIFKKNNPEIKEIFSEIFLSLTEQFMKEVNNDEKKNYLFSGLYSSRLLQKNKSRNGLKIESLSYPSVKMEYGLSNIAILNSLALEKLDLVSITLMNIAETNYDKNLIKQDDFIKVAGIQYKVTDFDFANDAIIYNPQDEFKLKIDLYDKYNLWDNL